MKILILKPSSLGDVVQALPVLRLLKLHYPASQIYWWIEAGLSPILKNDPDLSGIFVFDRKRWSSPFHWNELIRSIRELRAHRFDLVIDLQGLARSGTFAWLANGGTLIGVDDPREGAAGFYDMRVARPGYHTHAVDWYLEILRKLQVPVHQNFDWIPVNDYVRAVVDQRRAALGPYVFLNPGARWLNKRWPVEHFAVLAQELRKEFPELGFVVSGAKDEKALGNAIQAVLPERCLNLAGEISLTEMVEWIRGSQVVVTNDTGPMHIAAALRKPTLALFGPTDASRTGPYGQMSNVMRISLPCAPCMKDRCSNSNYLECLKGISPGKVAEAVRSRLQEPSPRTASL